MCALSKSSHNAAPANPLLRKRRDALRGRYIPAGLKPPPIEVDLEQGRYASLRHPAEDTSTFKGGRIGSFPHPVTQETQLAAAENAGAEMRRGVSVENKSQNRLLGLDHPERCSGWVLTEYSRTDTSPAEALPNQCTRWCCIDRLSWHAQPEAWKFTCTISALFGRVDCF